MLASAVDAVFFDLDGTLFDTAADLAYACNDLLKKYQRKAVPLGEFREWISEGTLAIICNSFDITQEDKRFAVLKNEFLALYQQNLVSRTQLYPGILTVLDFLDKQRLPWGVVTGKATSFATRLLEHFGLHQRSGCLVGGDTSLPSKPDPASLLHACDLLEVSPERCVYVGDAYTDIMAAHAASMRSIAVTYGYHQRHYDPYQWQAHYVVATPLAIKDCLQSF